MSDDERIPVEVGGDGVVVAERIGPVLLVTLNRPEARNAVNLELALAVGRALEIADEERSIRVVVITGAGELAFCAGADLKAVSANALPASSDPRLNGWGFAGYVKHSISKPTIAAVLFERAGIPVNRSFVASTESDLDAILAAVPGPFAVKVLSADILHKSDIGGVVLGATGAAGVRSAFRTVVNAGRNVDGARVDGALLSELLPPAVELLVGVVRDPDWGPVLSVAFGGVHAEVINDSVLIPLPTSPARIRERISSLRGFPLLTGARGTTPADLGLLVETAMRLAELASVLGAELESVEINPLRVDGADIRALDAVLTWHSEQPSQHTPGRPTAFTPSERVSNVIE